ncbi:MULTISPECIES: hypothetical protein [unclassified Sporosarcina]|uniref:hypothetical protein n=1 Tax=unclassified Sporosarcina TaxID=2647733 RepID=UPI001A924AA8|nr:MULTISPECIES: hypothetical protein [unclassified Sporosarcina]MBO0587612.1 hypothetical protein [Sporosarcina sp. E16_8]MBO0602398.1 hypothetical protein [Sporosarcina sp. E16_3]
MKKIYIASLSLSSIVLLFLIMKFFGWTVVINQLVFDKWIALIAVFSVPTSVYMILSKLKTHSGTVKKLALFSVILTSLWCLWAFKVQPYYFAYVGQNDILPQSYLVSEKRNSKTPETKFDVFDTKYTIFKSVTPFLFKKESTIVNERGIIFMSRKIVKTVIIDGDIYITNGGGLLPVK